MANIFVLILLFPSVAFSQNKILSEGPGCEVLRTSLDRESIPGTSLSTGTFYVVRLKSKNILPGAPFGYVTWTARRHDVTGHGYVFADSHHDMSNYLEGGKWYADSQWAFLKSSTPGWYNLINCGYPQLYTTWSNWPEESYGPGKFPLILDPNHPGNHSLVDFLFKPVPVDGSVFHLVIKSFGGGVVTESSQVHSDSSHYLQVEKGLRAIEDKDDTGMFIFEKSTDNTSSGGGGTRKLDNCVMLCSCVRKVLFAVFTTLCGICSLFGLVLIYKPKFIYKRFQ